MPVLTQISSSSAFNLIPSLLQLHLASLMYQNLINRTSVSVAAIGAAANKSLVRVKCIAHFQPKNFFCLFCALPLGFVQAIYCKTRSRTDSVCLQTVWAVSTLKWSETALCTFTITIYYYYYILFYYNILIVTTTDTYVILTQTHKLLHSMYMLLSSEFKDQSIMGF